jgi:membrane associated rhomboid family serine protease
MSRYYDSENNEQQPLLWLGGYAIYAAHFIVVVYVATLFVTTACQALRVESWFVWLSFNSAAVLHGQAWRVLSYGLLNPPSIGFVIDMFMIGWFGRELEKHFGRRLFLLLYIGIYLLSPLLLTGIGLFQPTYLAGEIGAFALFIAFATLYPNVPVLFNVLAKWVAIILVGLYTLIHLSNRDLAGLISLWGTVGFAHSFVRIQQGQWTLPHFRLPRKKPQLRVLEGGKAPAARPAPVPDRSVAEMDALLDKIARSGMDSLTAKERERLQQSREAILRNKGTSRR